MDTKSKSQEKREAVMHSEPSAEVKAETKPTHRYVCEGCTGVAGVSSIPNAVRMITCKVCGKSQECKPGNWIAL